MLYTVRESTFALSQRDDGVISSTGTTLWPAAQCLAFCLPKPKSPGARLCDLGAGTGLTALSAAALGWDVLATDVPDVISCVLALNIWQNISALPAGSGKIEVSPLDWTRASESWTWGESVKPPFDLICSADTVYSPDLIQPFLRTIRDLCVLSASRRPAVFICLERRDPALIDRFVSEAKASWDFSAERLSGRKLRKAAATHLQWTAENWEGIELWKLKYRY
ncbi:hypothetical protein FISHEDRAFT_38287 [Fistulina hepatica ATCC 64428]|nr:hypothetical protein FISHEDRAFT_38287 [Fistulina hepatica ATCC 64428]